MIINYSLFKRTTDNVTCIFICFENFRKLIEEDFPCPRIPGSFHYKEDENLNFLHLKSKNKLNCDFNTEMTKITNTKPSPISLSTYRGAFPKFKFNNNMYLQGELFNQFETLDKFHTQKNKQQADLPSVRTFYNGGLSSNRNFPTLTPRSKGNKKI